MKPPLLGVGPGVAVSSTCGPVTPGHPRVVGQMGKKRPCADEEAQMVSAFVVVVVGG